MGVHSQLVEWAVVLMMSKVINVPPKHRGISYLRLVKRVELGHLHMQCIGWKSGVCHMQAAAASCAPSTPCREAPFKILEASMQACRMWGTGKQAHMRKSLVGIYTGKPRAAPIDVFKRAFLNLTRPSSLLMLTHMFSMVLISLMGTVLNTNHNPCRKKKWRGACNPRSLHTHTFFPKPESASFYIIQASS